MTTLPTTNLGELITLFYEEYLALYGDENVAAVAAAATINDLITEPDDTAFGPPQEEAA